MAAFVRTRESASSRRAECHQPVGQAGFGVRLVADEPDGPGTDLGVRVTEEPLSQLRLESLAAVERPARLQGRRPSGLDRLAPEHLEHRPVVRLPLAEQAAGPAAIPAVRVGTDREKLLIRKGGQIDRFGGGRFGRWGGDAIDPAVGPIPLGVGVRMSGSRVVPIGDIDRSVWSHRHVGGSEPGVVRDQQFAAMSGLKRRAARFDVVPIDSVAEQVAGDVFASERFRE